jgi:hypothetical protein
MVLTNTDRFYFISVGAQKKGDDLKITNVYPSEFRLMTMKQGAFTYHDWDGLILTQVPAELSGQVLFTTVRGRAREAHLVSAFRKTQTPSSAIPDQVLLTFSGDPKTTMNIQWRADKAVEEGIVKYWQEQGGDTLTVKGTGFKMEDRLLQNDRFVNRFTARLDKLQPGTKYFYKVGATSGKCRRLRISELNRQIITDFHLSGLGIRISRRFGAIWLRSP